MNILNSCRLIYLRAGRRTMENSRTKSNKKIFTALSIGILLSIIGQIIFLSYLLTKNISLTLPIKWYIWFAITLGSGWILYFGVIYFEPNKKAKTAFSILGLCGLLIYINVWLIGSPILWAVSIAALIILLSVAVYLYRSTIRQQSQPEDRVPR